MTLKVKNNLRLNFFGLFTEENAFNLAKKTYTCPNDKILKLWCVKYLSKLGLCSEIFIILYVSSSVLVRNNLNVITAYARHQWYYKEHLIGNIDGSVS